MADILVPIVAIVFSLSIPIVAIITELLNRKNKMKVIEKAIEKGMTLEGLSLWEDKKPRAPYRSGMIALAAGIGVCIFAFFIGKMETDALYPLLGLGSIPVLIGAALIINDKINYNRYFNQDPDSPSP